MSNLGSGENASQLQGVSRPFQRLLVFGNVAASGDAPPASIDRTSGLMGSTSYLGPERVRAPLGDDMRGQ